jgi:hypothetical protein
MELLLTLKSQFYLVGSLKLYPDSTVASFAFRSPPKIIFPIFQSCENSKSAKEFLRAMQSEIAVIVQWRVLNTEIG